jgi:hypothetical protein
MRDHYILGLDVAMRDPLVMQGLDRLAEHGHPE